MTAKRRVIGYQYQEERDFGTTRLRTTDNKTRDRGGDKNLFCDDQLSAVSFQP